MQSLLEKTRRVNRLLNESVGHVDPDDMARLLSEVIRCDAYLADRGGKIMGYALLTERRLPATRTGVDAVIAFPETYNARLLKIDRPHPNLRPFGGRRDRWLGRGGFGGKTITTVIPVVGGDRRLGTLVLARDDGEFGYDDLVVGELGATVFGRELLRRETLKVKADARGREAAKAAVDSLSYSELQAAPHIFAALGGRQGLIVCSNIAARLGVSKSVVVNALAKWKSGGVIESRNVGTKGTYIRVLNDFLVQEVWRRRGRIDVDPEPAPGLFICPAHTSQISDTEMTTTLIRGAAPI